MGIMLLSLFILMIEQIGDYSVSLWAEYAEHRTLNTARQRRVRRCSFRVGCSTLRSPLVRQQWFPLFVCPQRHGSVFGVCSPWGAGCKALLLSSILLIEQTG